MATIALDIRGKGFAVQSYQGEVQQLTDVIVRHLARFRRIALRPLRNSADAEDAVQDAFLSAFTHLDQFRGQAKMSTRLTAIVINVARHEVASTFTASANLFRRNPRRPKPSARSAARPPTKPRTGVLQAGTCRKTRRRANTTLAHLA